MHCWVSYGRRRCLEKGCIATRAGRRLPTGKGRMHGSDNRQDLFIAGPPHGVLRPFREPGVFGAGSGNRTRTKSLEGSCDTISPYPLGLGAVYFSHRCASSEDPAPAPPRATAKGPARGRPSCSSAQADPVRPVRPTRPAGSREGCPRSRLRGSRSCWGSSAGRCFRSALPSPREDPSTTWGKSVRARRGRPSG